MSSSSVLILSPGWHSIPQGGDSISMTMLITVEASCKPWLVLAGLGSPLYKPEVSSVLSLDLINLIESGIKETYICPLAYYRLVYH